SAIAPPAANTTVNSTQGNHYALDNLRHSTGALAAWFGQFIYHGRIHSHSARDRGRDPDHQPHRRPADPLAPMKPAGIVGIILIIVGIIGFAYGGLGWNTEKKDAQLGPIEIKHQE